MASSNCSRVVRLESENSSLAPSRPLIRLDRLVEPSRPMCATCCTSVGSPISMLVSMSSSSSSLSSSSLYISKMWERLLKLLNSFLIPARKSRSRLAACCCWSCSCSWSAFSASPTTPATSPVNN
uniref:Uncharacterized protein n=1 Tax=Zea mays TaxID=4577 RepID=A0A804NLP1_MAIZE